MVLTVDLCVVQVPGLDGHNPGIEFGFEPCRWRQVRRKVGGGGLFDENTVIVHGWFDEHAEHFSPGVKSLLTAEGLVRPFGMGFIRSR